MGRYFGTDGFRGGANESLTAVHAFRVGRFLGRYFSKGKDKAKIVVGKDTRLSSYMFEYALTAGAVSSGADVYLLHVTTTPSVSFVTRTEGFDCGVMISASHNSYTDNGIKLIGGNGEKMQEDVLALIEDFLDGGNLPFATGDKIGRTIDYVAGRNRYLGYLLSIPRTSFRGLRVGLDCANGSAWALSKGVFDALGAEVYLLSVQPNGLNINEGCGSLHPERLQEEVKRHNLDVGFAFDGDADRCIAVDERGEIVDGDGILYLCAKYLAGRGELSDNTIAATVMSNSGLMRALGKEGVSVRLTDVGDKHVYEEMVKYNLTLGGEESGHIIFRKHATTGDGILTAIKLAEILLESKCPLSYLVRGYTPMARECLNVRVWDKNLALSSEEVRRAEKKAIEKLNGGRVLLRASGTEPVVRILAEGDNLSVCVSVAKSIAQVIEKITANNG